MMHSENKEMFVGAISVMVLVVLIMFSYSGEKGAGPEDAYRVTAVFNRIDGLYEDSDVRLGGVKVGSVASAKLDSDFRAVVQLEIENGVNLPKDTSAAIHTDGIFGSKFIELEPGGDENNLGDGDAIDMTQSSVVIEELLDLIIAEGKAKKAQAAQKAD